MAVDWKSSVTSEQGVKRHEERRDPKREKESNDEVIERFVRDAFVMACEKVAAENGKKISCAAIYDSSQRAVQRLQKRAYASKIAKPGNTVVVRSSSEDNDKKWVTIGHNL